MESETRFTKPTRTLNLIVDKSKNVSLGFNIRGGSDFGLGIFVSGVTVGSIADKAGFALGDQILSINGRSMDDITHQEAVEFILSFSNLSVVVKAAGKVPDEYQPAGKHVFISNTGEKIIEDCGDFVCHDDYIIEVLDPLAPVADSYDSEIDSESIVPVDQSDNVIPEVDTDNQDENIDPVCAADLLLHEPIIHRSDNIMVEMVSHNENEIVVTDTNANTNEYESVLTENSLVNKDTIVEIDNPVYDTVNYAYKHTHSNRDAIVINNTNANTKDDSLQNTTPAKQGMRLDVEPLHIPANNYNSDVVTPVSPFGILDEEASLIPLSPTDIIAPMKESAVVMGTAAVNVSVETGSIKSNSSKKSGKSVGSQKSKTSSKNSKNKSGNKFGSLKWRKNSKNKIKKDNEQQKENVLGELDNNVVSSNNQNNFNSHMVISTNRITHNENIGNSVSPQISFNGSETSTTNSKSGSLKGKRRSSKNKNGSENGSVKNRSVKGGGSVKDHSGGMKARTGSIKNKEQERGTIIFERDNLVEEVYECVRDSFTAEEFETIKEAIAMYHKQESVEDLLNHILPLFTPLKFILLRTIRKVVYADEVIKYDGLITSYLGRKKREFILGKRSQTVRSTSPWAEDDHRQASVRAGTFGVPLPGSPDGGSSKVVVKPVISSFQSTDQNVADEEIKGDVPPAYESTDIKMGGGKDEGKSSPEVEASHTVFHFQQPETQTVVMDTVVAVPNQEVRNISENESAASEETGFKAEIKTEPAPEETEFKAEVKTEHAPDETEFKAEMKTEQAPSPFASPTKVKKIITEVERIEVISQPTHKPYIEVKKEVSGDSAILSVHTGTGDGTKDDKLVFKDSSYDDAKNHLTINAMLNIEKPKQNNSDKPKLKKGDAAAAAAAVEISTLPTKNSKYRQIEANKDMIVDFENPVYDTVEGFSKVNHDETNDTDIVPMEENNHKTRYIDKIHKFIGMTISGGSDSQYQNEIRVVAVQVNSASYHAGIRIGQQLLSINEHSLLDVTHAEACRFIRNSFRDKTNNIMKICVVEDEEEFL